MSRTRMLAIGGGVLVFAVAAVVTLLATREAPEPPQAAPPPSTSASPSVSPTPTPTPQSGQPQPFEVRLVRTSRSSIGNEELFGRAQRPGRRTIPRAAQGAVRELERYLNDAFVRPKTRFRQPPVNRLLTARAHQELTAPARKALGVGLTMRSARTQPATASAFVLHDGSQVVSVTLRYAATMHVVLDSGRKERWTQKGSLLLVSKRGRWRADMVDVELVRT